MRARRLLIVLLLPALASAQDVELAFGGTHVDGGNGRTFGARVSWYQPLAPNVAASLAYVNEGHVPGHHRDGLAAQAWLTTGATRPGLELAAGLGPYQYFDTAHAESADGFRDAHGTGLAGSVAATWRPAGSRWSWIARVDRFITRRDHDATQVMLGVGWQAQAVRGDGSTPGRRDDDEIVGGFGQTIVNSFESQKSTSAAIDCRHALGPALRVSLGWLHEGDARLIRRDGVLARAWLEPRFGEWTFGFGAGAYFAVDEYREEPRHVSPVVGFTMSRRISGPWVARLEWIRVVSNYDRDSDVILLGAGYRF